MASGSSTVALTITLERAQVTSTTAVCTTLEIALPRKATNYRAVHFGALSIDNHDLTQQQIEDAVNALVATVPSLSHIIIGTYMDYPAQIALWAQAIHATGKKFVLRSAGFNDWQGTNGITQYTAADFADHAISQYVAFVNTNYAIFQAGDILEPFPDSPENNTCWNNLSGTGAWADILYEGTDRSWVERLFDWDTSQWEAAFNTFIADAVSQVTAALAGHVAGVTTNVLYMSPMVARDIITSTTASLLRAIGTNDYPESGLTTVNDQALAMQNEITTLINPAQSSTTPWHITFGPNSFAQLDQTTQAATLAAQFRTILTTLTHPLDGITVSPFGDYANASKGRLFGWDEAAWPISWLREMT